WFSQTIGYCTPKAKQLTFIYDSIEDFYNGGEEEWRLSGLFSNKELEKMRSTPLSVSEEIIAKCNHYYYDAVCIDSPGYPECLFEIDDPPAVLYISGALPDIDDRMSIAVIGTRRASMYGIKSSYEFAYNLAKAGVTIVSGGALGVDCSSHLGALAADGVTICVLGCGINYDYLRENAKMRSDITFKGAVISEYPPDTEPYSYHFPQRNRIISALSDGILVIEAGSKSGSLITVNSALEQDASKKIFALAGPVDSHFDGSNKLVKDKVATLVTDYKDIIDAFDSVYVTTELDISAQPSDDIIDVIPIKGKAPTDINGLKTYDLTEVPVHKTDLNLSDDESTVYYAIGFEPIHIDKISENTNLPVFKLLPILTMLELRGLIKCVQGRSYRLI
ncbi:MAG: DNA-processing protein DprA, partial [Ruminococcus sp.]|nr:DNA-processing protein DprA [Ruminococcus sp.]